MNFTQLPLPFGNITLAVLTLFVTLIALYFIVEVGIFIIKKTLALDTEDAPDIEVKNPVVIILNLFNISKRPVHRYKVVWNKGNYTKGFVIKELCSSRIYDPSDNTFSNTAFTASHFKSEEEANGVLISKGFESKEELTVDGALLGKVLAGAVIIDSVVFMLSISFIPTLCVTLTFTTMFCIRTLAKRFYSGMKNHKDRLDGHDKELDELKSKGDSDE